MPVCATWVRRNTQLAGWDNYTCFLTEGGFFRVPLPIVRTAQFYCDGGQVDSRTGRCYLRKTLQLLHRGGTWGCHANTEGPFASQSKPPFKLSLLTFRPQFRTEVSEASTEPAFTKKSFTFDVPGGLSDDFVAHARSVEFSAFVMLPPKNAQQGTASQKNFLGSASYQLGGGVELLRAGKPAAAKVTFIRRPQPNEEVPVGKLEMTLTLDKGGLRKAATDEDPAGGTAGGGGGGGGGGAARRGTQAIRMDPGSGGSINPGRALFVTVHSGRNLPLAVLDGSGGDGGDGGGGGGGGGAASRVELRCGSGSGGAAWGEVFYPMPLAASQGAVGAVGAAPDSPDPRQDRPYVRQLEAAAARAPSSAKTRALPGRHPRVRDSRAFPRELGSLTAHARRGS